MEGEPDSSPDKYNSDSPEPYLKQQTPSTNATDNPLICADNTHLIVEEKLEKIREEKEAAEAKLHEGEEEKKVKKAPAKMILCSAQTKYRVVKKACRKLDYKLNEDDTVDWDLYWADTGIQPQRIQKMQSYQRINHYPGMCALSHKNNLCRNLKRMQKLFPNEYDFFPKTWILPSDSSDFKQ